MDRPCEMQKGTSQMGTGEMIIQHPSKSTGFTQIHNTGGNLKGESGPLGIWP